MAYEFSSADVRYITTNYTKGTGLAALAEEYGVSIPVIRRILVEQNVKIRHRGRPALSA